MELIKIEPLDPCLMEECTLTEEECDQLLQEINNIVSSSDDTSVNKVVREAISPETIATIATVGASGVLLIIAMIRKFIKNKYSMNVKRILDQSKEINDMYTKIEYLLKNDKMARFKHRNDTIKTELKYVILQDTLDGKMYNVTSDFLAYDSDVIMQNIRTIMNYIDSSHMTPEEEKNSLDAWVNSQINSLQNSFIQNHWYTTRCKPLMKTEVYNAVKIEKAIVHFKNNFGSIYQYIGSLNKLISTEMTYLQLVEKSYKSAISMYGTNSTRKESIDKLFKKILELATNSITFNSSILDMMVECVTYYANELERIYNILRQ